MKNNQLLHTIRFVLILVLVIMAGLLLAACGGSQQDDMLVVGVLLEVDGLQITYQGLKDGMAELGYVEGETITYVGDDAVGGEAANIDSAIEERLAQDVDVLFALGTAPAYRASLAVEGKDIPVVFAPVINPIAEGVVASLDHPGQTVSGVQTGDTLPKSIEWFLTVAPVTTIYTPYHPDDAVSVTSVEALSEIATTLGVDVIADEVTSPEEVVEALAELPDDTGMFLVPFPSLEPGLDDYLLTAMEAGIPVGAYHPAYIRDGLLVNFSVDLYEMGKQAARLVDQIAQGTDAKDLPVETADDFLTVNLATADAIGIEVSDDVLRQAETIIR